MKVRIDMDRTPAASGDLTFSAGHIMLSDFSIEGIREEGDPISFEQNFGASGLTVQLTSASNVSELDYDIPQGVYTSLEIAYNTVSSNNSLVITGQYTNSSSVTYPFRFEFWSSESFEIEAEDDSGTGKIAIEKNTSPICYVKLDPEYWFQPISTSSLDGATLTNISGTPTLLINEETNESIYDIIADRIDDSLEATFAQ